MRLLDYYKTEAEDKDMESLAKNCPEKVEALLNNRREMNKDTWNRILGLGLGLGLLITIGACFIVWVLHN